MQYTQEVTLELNSNTAYTTIGAKQGDNNSRVVKVYLTENGTEYTIPAGYTSFFRFRKPDGKAIVNSANISDDRKSISITLTAQTLAVAGRGYADVVLQSGSNVLSTVSFIIIIMAAPSVGEEMASSNEFGYLSEVVTSATDTIYAAEAWAAGTRGGQEVISESKFEWDTEATGISTSSVAIVESTFKGVVGTKPGLSRVFTFTYVTNTNGNYWLLDETDSDGITSTTYDQAIVNDISTYGITISTGTPANNDKILVTVQDKDLAANNNAKYYAELLENLTVSATSTTGSPMVTKTTVDGHYNFAFAIPKGDTGDPAAIATVSATASGLSSAADPTVTVFISGPSDAAHLDFNFGIPMSASVNTVDGVGADSNRNIPLGAVRYNSSQSLTLQQQAQARGNIHAFGGQINGALTSGQFLKFVGLQNSIQIWETAEVNTTIASYSIIESALDTGAVSSRAIASFAVTESALNTGAVTSNAIAPSAVTSIALAFGAVIRDAIAQYAVGSSALATGAVTANAIASSAVTSYAIASGCIESWHFSQNLWGDSRLYGSGS